MMHDIPSSLSGLIPLAADDRSAVWRMGVTMQARWDAVDSASHRALASINNTWRPQSPSEHYPPLAAWPPQVTQTTRSLTHAQGGVDSLLIAPISKRFTESCSQVSDDCISLIA